MEYLKLAFIADIHHYSEKLGSDGRAYELREGSDQKCLKETSAVIDAAFSEFLSNDTDCICIAGDITNDGEKVSHDEFFEKAKALNSEKPVYVITSTHDWCSDNNPRRFEGNEIFNDVDTLTVSDLAEKYSIFGAENCISSYKTRIGLVSRCFQLSDSLRLLAVHDDCDAEGGRSGYSDEHLSWMIEMLNKAKEDGCKVIAMEHHLLLHPFCKTVNSGQSIGDNFRVASILADNGLRLMFVGHSHMQRTTEFVSENGNKITQINLGSLTGHPAPITYVTFDGENARINVEFLREFTYKGQKCDDEYLKKHTLGVLFNLLEAGKADKTDFYERLRANGIKIPSYNLLYPFIKCICKKLLKAKCRGTGRLINFFTFGKAIDTKALREIGSMPLLELVSKVFLSVFDGSYSLKDASEAEIKVLLDVGRLPSAIIRRLPVKQSKKDKILRATDDIGKMIETLTVADAAYNENTVIAL